MAGGAEKPTVLRMRPGAQLFAAALGLALIAYGAYVFSGDGRAARPMFGAFAALAGLILAGASARGLLAGRPSLAFYDDRLVFTPNFGAPQTLAFRDVAGVGGYFHRFDQGVEIRAKDGRRLKIPAFQGGADDLRAQIERALSRSRPENT